MVSWGKESFGSLRKFLDEVRIKIRRIDQAHTIIKDVAKLYDSAIKRRSMTKNQVEFKLNKLSYTDQFNGLDRTELALEAIIEDEAAKKRGL